MMAKLYELPTTNITPVDDKELIMKQLELLKSTFGRDLFDSLFI